MYVLVEYNSNYKDILEILKSKNITPVTLFKINLENKNQIKTDLDKIIKLKQKIKPQFSAIQISVYKIENSTIGTINNMKNNFDVVIGLGGLNKVNRMFLEQTKIDFLQDPQNSYFKIKMDYVHHFNSGLNHVLCKEAQNNDIKFIFSLNFLKSTNEIIVPKEIGRINQNLRFARKYSIESYVNLIVKHPQDIKTIDEINTIQSIFDLSQEQKNQTENILEKTINTNKSKQSKNYISESINVVE